MSKKRELSSEDEAFLHNYQQKTSEYYDDISSKLLEESWKRSKMTEKDKRQILNFCQDKIKYGLQESEQKDVRLETPFTLLIAGKTKCGKTHLLLHLLRHWRSITDDEKGFYTKHIYWFYGTQSQEQMNEMKDIFDDFRNELNDEEEGPTLHFVLGDFKSEECKRILENMENAIVIFDDLMDEMISARDLSKCFTRDSHHKKLNLVYLWQDIFPKQDQARVISKNTDYKIVFDNPCAVKSLEIMIHQMFAKEKAQIIFKKIQAFFLNSKPKSFPCVFFNLKPNQDPSKKIIIDPYSDRSSENIKCGVLSKPIEHIKI